MKVIIKQGSQETVFDGIVQNEEINHYLEQKLKTKIQAVSFEFYNDATLDDVSDLSDIDFKFVKESIITLHDEGK